MTAASWACIFGITLDVLTLLAELLSQLVCNVNDNHGVIDLAT